MPEPLSAEDVRHVARLARLRLSPEQVHSFRTQLSSILDHLATLAELDLEGVDASPAVGAANRLADDVVADAMPLADLQRNAPAVEGPFLAVPKILDHDA